MKGGDRMSVSIVMAVYNGEAYLKETLKGILAQIHPELEIVIVNDGSNDSTSKILNKIKDERVKVIHLERNQGVANALNFGISQAKGKWIAIHDADDISLPHRIEEQVAYIQANPHVIAVGSFIECIEGKDIPPARVLEMKKLEAYKNSIVTWEKIKDDLLKGCPITHGSLLMTIEAYHKAGGYDPQYRIASDYDFFTRLAAVGPIENIPKVLYKYRISFNSLSNSNVLETSKEFLLAATRYIRNSHFAHKKDKPSVIVYGTKEGVQAFDTLMISQGDLNVVSALFRYQQATMVEAYNAYRSKKIDAFIILANAPEENRLITFLSLRGLKVNKDFYTLWSAL